MALSRDKVLLLIVGERDYQDAQAEHWNHKGVPSIESELLQLEHYISEARLEWVKNSDHKGVLNTIRKISAIGIRAMEHHGAEAGPNGPMRMWEK